MEKNHKQKRKENTGGKQMSNENSEKCGCGALNMNAGIFAGFEPSDRVKKAMIDFRILYEVGRYSDIVKMTVLLPSTKEEMIKVIEAQERLLDQLGRKDLTETENRHTKNFEGLMDAINGSCSQEVKKGLWKHSREVQEFLLKFTQESKGKEAYWRDLILKDFQGNTELDQTYHWFQNAEAISGCIELFGLPKETIIKRAECTILSEFSHMGFDNLATFAENSKKLIDLIGIPEGKIQKKLCGIIDRNVKDFPAYCMNAAKKMGLSLEPWKDLLHAGANRLILDANNRKCPCERQSRIQSAIDIYETLKKDFGDSRGDALMTLWQNKGAENAERDFLRQASKILHFEYKPVDLTERVGLWWGRIS
jgi:hypothetical protein